MMNIALCNRDWEAAKGFVERVGRALDRFGY